MHHICDSSLFLLKTNRIVKIVFFNILNIVHWFTTPKTLIDNNLDKHNLNLEPEGCAQPRKILKTHIHFVKDVFNLKK